MNCSQLREQIIRPTLHGLGLWSESAELLLLGTAATESHMGEYIKQVGGGPALGIYQMEPATEGDIWNNYLLYKPELAAKVSPLLLPSISDQLVGNLYYSTAMCRIHYLRVSQKLPAASNIHGLAKYWKDHYNTVKGKGTVEKFISDFNRYVK